MPSSSRIFVCVLTSITIKFQANYNLLICHCLARASDLDKLEQCTDLFFLMIYMMVPGFVPFGFVSNKMLIIG